MNELAFQAKMLQRVSRTYARTIPVLPDGLRHVVANAYLLCRLADTIEDEPQLPLPEKEALWERLVGLVSGGPGGSDFARDLAAALSAASPPAERELARGADRILRITSRFPPAHRLAEERCIRIMCEGMVEFQGAGTGLRDLDQLDRYCYVAAGVVGELMVDLLCAHSEEIAVRRKDLLGLARSHAEGLQLTNILVDVWDDRDEGRCWLPREVFEAEGFDLDRLARGAPHPGFDRGMDRLVGVARGHLEDAIRFTLLIPARETGIRRHLLWGICLAVLALRRVHRQRSFRRGENVRLSRWRVGAAILVASAVAAHDRLLRAAFRAATRGLGQRSG